MLVVWCPKDTWLFDLKGLQVPMIFIRAHLVIASLWPCVPGDYRQLAHSENPRYNTAVRLTGTIDDVELLGNPMRSKTGPVRNEEDTTRRLTD